jgi:hypothetical protein
MNWAYSSASSATCAPRCGRRHVRRTIKAWRSTTKRATKRRSVAEKSQVISAANGAMGGFPSPAPNKSLENQHQCVSIGDVPASTSLNEPRTVPTCPADLGKRRAKRSRKVPDGAPLQKRRAGSASTEHGSKSKSRSPRKTQEPVQAAKQQSLYVYDGQIWLGRIEKDGDLGFAAFTTADGLLGSFENLKAAADAVAMAAAG